MFDLIKREFIESRLIQGAKNIPYTFNERRFYQVFYFDFLISSPRDLQELSIAFPKELGTVYTTFTESTNQELHQGDIWTYHAPSNANTVSNSARNKQK